MKFVTHILSVLVFLSAASASAKELVRCDGGEETQLSIVRGNDGKLTALLQIQSFGGSYPIYRIPVQKIERAVQMVGAPVEYKGKNFDLLILVDTAPSASRGILSHLHSPLSATSSLYCKIK